MHKRAYVHRGKTSETKAAASYQEPRAADRTHRMYPRVACLILDTKRTSGIPNVLSGHARGAGRDRRFEIRACPSLPYAPHTTQTQDEDKNICGTVGCESCESLGYRRLLPSRFAGCRSTREESRQQASPGCARHGLCSLVPPPLPLVQAAQQRRLSSWYRQPRAAGAQPPAPETAGCQTAGATAAAV